MECFPVGSPFLFTINTSAVQSYPQEISMAKCIYSIHAGAPLVIWVQIPVETNGIRCGFCLVGTQICSNTSSLYITLDSCALYFESCDLSVCIHMSKVIQQIHIRIYTTQQKPDLTPFVSLFCYNKLHALSSLVCWYFVIHWSQQAE